MDIEYLGICTQPWSSERSQRRVSTKPFLSLFSTSSYVCWVVWFYKVVSVKQQRISGAPFPSLLPLKGLQCACDVLKAAQASKGCGLFIKLF